MWEPMAITIMFRLLFATVLKLGVVPVLYTLFFQVNFKNFQYRPNSLVFSPTVNNPTTPQKLLPPTA